MNINSDFEFLTKRELLEKYGEEKIVLTVETEEKLKSFVDNDLLAIEMTINSPTKIIDVSLFDMPIVDFINGIFEKDGIKREAINKVFGSLGRD